jgi:hypothetical protein
VWEWIEEVPKVTPGTGCVKGGIALSPSSCGADQPISDHTEPEVYDEAPIHLERPVARQVKGGGEEEVGQVSQDDAAEGLDEIDEQICSRHEFYSMHTFG